LTYIQRASQFPNNNSKFLQSSMAYVILGDLSKAENLSRQKAVVMGEIAEESPRHVAAQP